MSRLYEEIKRFDRIERIVALGALFLIVWFLILIVTTVRAILGG